MHAHRAVVKNGRLILDEPTDLPDGKIVELVTVEDVIASSADDLDDEQRAALLAELRAAVADTAGEEVDAAVVLEAIRAQR